LKGDIQFGWYEAKAVSHLRIEDPRHVRAGRNASIYLRVLSYSLFEQCFYDGVSLWMTAIMIFHVTQYPVNYDLMVNLKNFLLIWGKMIFSACPKHKT